MTGAPGKPPIDHAFAAADLKGGAADPTYAGWDLSSLTICAEKRPSGKVLIIISVALRQS